ncbi:hypothetical protein RD055328_09870 [Companilactobacillus sp. RD055328]|uniref:glycosyltransferase family 2 protein n=1 Tax=Companilactobacillus sp. RD055328 TaxID=2916634 RepID=UPI001FC8DBB9|nr:glycosyltransferase family 2 protein [Companilactobacillus sp. RD055328]GKQ43064.1 hypothetical protein RD055328_09870 [Companilactobacillus sp. RD055328]
MENNKNALPLITVAIPVYNCEKNLEQCLNSVITQTYSNLDILLINDGSTDRSSEICERFKASDDRIRLFHKKNGGVGASRNTILSLLEGDYVTFLDNDDWLEKNHVQSLYEQIQKHNSDISINNFHTFIEDEETFSSHGDFSNYFERDFTPEEWFANEYNTFNSFSMCFTVPWGKLFKRELLNDISFPESKVVEDDYTTYMIYLKTKKLSYAHLETYVHRSSNRSITANSDLTSVFPIQSIEERLTLLTILGYDVTNEISAYKWRLGVHKKTLLEKGDIAEYRRVVQKIKLIENYTK